MPREGFEQSTTFSMPDVHSSIYQATVSVLNINNNKGKSPSLPLTTKFSSTPPKQLRMTCWLCCKFVYLRIIRNVSRSQSWTSYSHSQQSKQNLTLIIIINPTLGEWLISNCCESCDAFTLVSSPSSRTELRVHAKTMGHQLSQLT